jgi:hypothetical protein
MHVLSFVPLLMMSLSMVPRLMAFVDVAFADGLC